MTTRREFIQGVLTGMVALVLPKTAKAMPLDEPVVEPEHGLRVEGKDCYVWPDTHISDWEPLLMIPTYAGTFFPNEEVEWDGMGWSPEITGDGSGVALPDASSTCKIGMMIGRTRT